MTDIAHANPIWVYSALGLLLFVVAASWWVGGLTLRDIWSRKRTDRHD